MNRKGDVLGKTLTFLPVFFLVVIAMIIFCVVAYFLRGTGFAGGTEQSNSLLLNQENALTKYISVQVGENNFKDMRVIDAVVLFEQGRISKEVLNNALAKLVDGTSKCGYLGIGPSDMGKEVLYTESYLRPLDVEFGSVFSTSYRKSKLTSDFYFDVQTDKGVKKLVLEQYLGACKK